MKHSKQDRAMNPVFRFQKVKRTNGRALGGLLADAFRIYRQLLSFYKKEKVSDEFMKLAARVIMVLIKELIGKWFR